MSPYLTVFIPAYNEANNLEHCVQVMRSTLQEWDISAEFLIVDDGSQDDTGVIADRLAKQMSGVRVVHHPDNRGIGGAFLTAVQQAAGEWMILIPADLALEPGEVRRYLDAASQPKATLPSDIVVGLRSDRSDYSLLRRLVSWANITLIRTLFQMKIHQFQYISMYRMDVLHQIKIEYWRSAFFLAEILIKVRDLGCRLVEVDIIYAPRLTGKPTGARLRLVIRTVVDILIFWLRWLPGRLARFPMRRKS